MNERRAQIEERLDQRIPPTEAEVRWLLADHADQAETIRVLTDAAIDFLHIWVETTNHASRPVFDDHAGQMIDK